MVEWQLQRWREEDFPAILQWFTDPEFYFGTTTPHLLSEPEIAAILDEEDTYVLYHHAQPIGVLRHEYAAPYAGTVLVTVRLWSGAPFDLWRQVLSLLPLVVWGRLDFWRIQIVCMEFDDLLQRACAAAGYTDEGMLSHLYFAHGRRWGARHFAATRPRQQPVERRHSTAQAG